jgi:hypothetical protein
MLPAAAAVNLVGSMGKGTQLGLHSTNGVLQSDG